MTELSPVVDVTIVVVSFNTRDLTNQCLKSIYSETGNVNFQVVVVDNASTDGSAQMVAEQFPQVTLIQNADNRGFAAANNQAFAIARGRHILLLNSDTIVLDRAIDRCVTYMDKHLDIGALGPKVLWPSGDHQSSAFRFPSSFGFIVSVVRASRPLLVKLRSVWCKRLGQNTRRRRRCWVLSDRSK